MPSNEKIIYVYDSFTFNEPKLLGKLYVDTIKGGETYAFEYDNDWLATANYPVSIDPDFFGYSGRQYPNGKFFGVFADASPDRWGRLLMNKKERKLADKEARKPRRLNESDFLIGVYDETRMGGIRFKLEENGEFLSNDKETATPPWATLRTLEEASRQFENDETALDEKWLNQLLRPGSSLGGARPKATVVDTKGQLWIAKFPSKNDTNNTGAWEKVVHDLARMCGLNVPESKLETFSKLGIVFNMAVSNTDDHLRNHAFILKKNGWVLSPLYDVNPVPYGDELSLNVDETDNRISISLAIETAHRFGIKEEDAVKMAKEITGIVKNNWEKLAMKYGISRGKIEDMRPAFSICYE